ncbi:MAG: hypothetical protein Q9227_007227 [Pyrenula ochraceoflavens]
MAGMMEVDVQDPPRGKLMKNESLNHGSWQDGSSLDGTATHPSSILPSRPFESYKDFHTVANDAFHGAFPVSNSPRYSKGVVLLLQWEDDDLGVGKQLSQLKDVFENAYRFETESFLIPSQRPDAKLSQRVYDFRDKHCPHDQAPDTPRPLLIVYYGGHSDRTNNNLCQWRSQMERVLLDSEADVLMLLDCCYIASPEKHTLNTSRGTNEILAAYGPEVPSTGLERSSFTDVLSHELESGALKCDTIGKPLTAVGLHRALVCDNRSMIFNPFYMRLTKFDCESIILIPSRKTESSTNNHNPDRLPSALSRVSEPSARALLAVHTSKLPNQDFVAYLRDEGVMPLFINGTEAVRVEAVYSTNSTMILVSVPIEVWNLIPDNDACRFVSLIRSKNFYQEELSQEMFSHQRRQSEPVFREPFHPNHDMFLPPNTVGVEDHGYMPGLQRPPSSLYSPSAAIGQLPPEAAGQRILPRPNMESPSIDPFRKPRGAGRAPLSPNAVGPKELKPPPARKGNDQYRVSKPAGKAALSPSTRKASNASKRPYVCSFIHYGCHSTFASKNEWKRHVTSQHLQLGFYRCDIGSCNSNNRQLGDSSPHNDFNRKDLFTQHCRRMHKPRSPSAGASLAKDEESFEASLEDVRQRCWTERRRPPQKSICGFCGRTFEGDQTWDNRMEHVSKHFEKGEGDEGEDEELRNWALQEGIVEKVGESQYRLAGLKDNGTALPTREGDDHMQMEEG